MQSLLLGLALGAGVWQLDPRTRAPLAIESQPFREIGQLISLHVTIVGAFADPPVLEVLQLVASNDDSSRWHLFARRLVKRAEAIHLSGPAERLSLLVVRDPGAPGYGLHGPFIWPRAATPLTITPSRSRTIRARTRARDPLTSAKWITASGTIGVSVDCRIVSDSSLECLGVAAEEQGVVLAEDTAGIAWSMPIPRPTRPVTIQDVVLERPPWGALFLLTVPGDEQDRALEASVWRSKRPVASKSTRFALTPIAGYRIDWVGRSAFWLTGPRPEDGSVLEVTGAGVATLRIPLTALALSSRESPVSISLTSSLEVTGRVVDDDGRAVARASVTVSEFVDDSGHVAQSAAPGWFRRRVEEVLTDDDGMFVVNALDHREYEWLAAHPQLGRALVITQPLVSMTIKVSAERRITGRVVKQGLPLAGVPVLILPLLDGLAESRDLLERIGQESQSDATGQFLVAVPSRFGGEVRIGSNSTGIVRRRFAAGTGRSVIDLGDIELGVRPTVEVHFDGRQNCDVAAVGPLGRVGMQVIAGIRNGGGSWRLQPPERGRWSIVVTCGNNVIAVEPSEFELRSEDIVLTVRIVSIER